MTIVMDMPVRVSVAFKKTDDGRWLARAAIAGQTVEIRGDTWDETITSMQRALAGKGKAS